MKEFKIMRIYLKYEELLENAQKLLSITEEYNEVILNIKKSCENIDKIWISDNKNLELDELTALNSDLNINKNYYKLFSEIIKSANENFLMLEQDASKYMTIENIKEVV